MADPDRPGHAARRGTGGGPGPAFRWPHPRPDRPATGDADRHGEVAIAPGAPAAGLDAGAPSGGRGMTSQPWLAEYLEQEAQQPGPYAPYAALADAGRRPGGPLRHPGGC